MPPGPGNQLRRLNPTLLHGLRATGVKVAARRRVDGRGHVTSQYLPLCLAMRVRYGDGRDQRTCIGVCWLAVDHLSFGIFHNLTQVHDRHAVGDVLHHRQIVGDKQVGQAKFLLQVVQQVDDLALDGDVEG